MDIEYEYSNEKNILLKEQRGISFEEIIFYINNGCLIDTIKHHNKAKYDSQEFYVVDVEGYIYLVPFVKQASKIFLKTIFPSRKHTKKYLAELNTRRKHHAKKEI